MAKNKHEDICSCRIFMVSITAINFFTFILTILAWQVICVVGSSQKHHIPDLKLIDTRVINTISRLINHTLARHHLVNGV